MRWQHTKQLAAFRTNLSQSSTDEELVERANAGDWSAFERLVKRHQDKFFRLAAGYFNNEADAHDALQEAFLKMYRNLDGFRGDAQFKSWAYRIVVNTSLSRIRKNKRRREVALENVGPTVQVDDEPSVTLANWRCRADEAAQDSELADAIADAVAQLEPKYRAVFLLYEVEGLSIED
ncbi:MAG: RNA polymerase sigma factor, partial [Persicimonas sp.]